MKYVMRSQQRCLMPGMKEKEKRKIKIIKKTREKNRK